MRIGWLGCDYTSVIAMLFSNPDRILHISPYKEPTSGEKSFIRRTEVLVWQHVDTLHNNLYSGPRDVVRKSGCIYGPGGAVCELQLKKRVRQEWEILNWGHHTYIWGLDAGQRERADRIMKSMPEFDHEFPLIEHNFSRHDCEKMCRSAGILEQVDLSLRDVSVNRCLGCVKGNKAYWCVVRQVNPDVFNEMAGLERELGRSCIPGCYLDELDPDEDYGPIRVGNCFVGCGHG